MPLVNINSLRKIDMMILKATGYELVPASSDDLIISFDNGRTYYALPVEKTKE